MVVGNRRPCHCIDSRFDRLSAGAVFSRSGSCDTARGCRGRTCLAHGTGRFNHPLLAAIGLRLANLNLVEVALFGTDCRAGLLAVGLASSLGSGLGADVPGIALLGSGPIQAFVSRLFTRANAIVFTSLPASYRTLVDAASTTARLAALHLAKLTDVSAVFCCLPLQAFIGASKTGLNNVAATPNFAPLRTLIDAGARDALRLPFGGITTLLGSSAIDLLFPFPAPNSIRLAGLNLASIALLLVEGIALVRTGARTRSCASRHDAALPRTRAVRSSNPNAATVRCRRTGLDHLTGAAGSANGGTSIVPTTRLPLRFILGSATSNGNTNA